MTNKEVAGLLDIIRDKNNDRLTKQEMEALIIAANTIRYIKNSSEKND